MMMSRNVHLIAICEFDCFWGVIVSFLFIVKSSRNFFNYVVLYSLVIIIVILI